MLVWTLSANKTSLSIFFWGFWVDLLICGEVFILQHVILPRKGPKRSQILNVCSFDPFYAVPRAGLANFWK